MKVYMSGYPRRLISNIHSHYMRKKYGWDWDASTTLFERALEKLEDGLNTVYNATINKLVPENPLTYVKIDDSDVWSMDHTLAQIVLPMLLKLKETKHGSPSVDDSDVPPELHNNHLKDANHWSEDPEEVAKSDEHYKLLHAKWDWVLDEMIFAFTYKVRGDWESDFYKYEHLDKADPDYSKHMCGMKLIWEDREGREQTQLRISNGFRLFGVYYERLWN